MPNKSFDTLRTNGKMSNPRVVSLSNPRVVSLSNARPSHDEGQERNQPVQRLLKRLFQGT